MRRVMKVYLVSCTLCREEYLVNADRAYRYLCKNCKQEMEVHLHGGSQWDD